MKFHVLYLQALIEELKDKMKPEHYEALRQIPFHHFTTLSGASSLNMGFAEAILHPYEPDTCAFRLDGDILLPFDAKEFSVVMGLQYFGRPIMENLKEKPGFASHLAQEKKKRKLSKVTRNLVIKKMKGIVDCGDCSETVLAEFKRVFVALMFMLVLFPMSHFNISNFLQLYLDDIDDLQQSVGVWPFIALYANR